MSNGINQEVWKKAWRVSQGIRKLLWAYSCFYFDGSVEQELKEYGVEVYINKYDKFAVKLEDGTEYELIQPCPHLIYDLYDAKDKVRNGESDEKVIRKASAYDKFEPFFEWMNGYVDKNIVGC